jgi:AbrB family looped-hinge helix DNA binding protein
MRTETEMVIKTVRVSEKGQIAIPRKIRERVGIKKGDELVMFQEDEKILLQKMQLVTKKTREEFDYLVKLSEGVFTKLWSNKKDEVWDKL